MQGGINIFNGVQDRKLKLIYNYNSMLTTGGQIRTHIIVPCSFTNLNASVVHVHCLQGKIWFCKMAGGACLMQPNLLLLPSIKITAFCLEKLHTAAVQVRI